VSHGDEVFEARDAVLADGGRASLRAIGPADAPALAALHSGLSGESRYFRYFSFRHGLSPPELERMVHPDFVHHGGMVALVEGELVGHACFDRKDEEADADVAYEVADAHHGRGIATLLLEALAQAARDAGIRRFRAHVLPGNRASLEVLRDLGFAERARFEDGAVRVTLEITPTDASRAASAARRAHGGRDA
jgi:RimJ/RimL family protein N-acetyltransferase